MLALSLGVAIVVVAAVMEWRTRRMLEYERLVHDDRLREQERIAGELHDMLVQSTQGFMLTVQAAAGLVPPESPARRMLDRALQRADAVLIDARDRVQQLRSLGIDPTDFPEALERLGNSLRQADGTRFEFTVKGRPQTLRVKVANDVYRMAREILTRVFHEAKPSLVEVRVEFAPAEFRLKIRDDGRGGAVVSDCVKEHAHALGASLEVRSREGIGTEIELQLPPSLAYLGKGA